MSDDLTPAERIAYAAANRSPEPDSPLVRPVSYRVPVRLLCEIDALAQLTQQSRNTTISSLIEAGLYAVKQEMMNRDEFDALTEAFSDQYLGE